MSNSSLVCYTKLSPNHSGKRTHSIDRITPHCVVGQLSCETICACFPEGRGASCNYGIGSDGRISLCVDEGNRSWCSSSNANDQRAVTIECASDKTEPYAMTDAVYESLVNLCTDICKRNGKKKLLWFADKDKTLGSQSSNNDVLYRVQTGAFSVKENADRMLEKVKAAGFDTYMIQVDGMYKIQVGAYSKKENADAMANKLKAAGFDTFITTHGGQAVSTTSTPTREVTIGSAVRLKKGAKTYSGGSLASFVYERNHQVTQLSGDRAVISYKGTVVAAVHKDDLILV